MPVTLVSISVKSEYIQEFIEATRLNQAASVRELGNCVSISCKAPRNRIVFCCMKPMPATRRRPGTSKLLITCSGAIP